MDEDLLNFTAGLYTSLPVWSNPAAPLQKSSWAQALLLSQATDCQSWRGVGKHLEDVGDADEGNAEKEAPGISWPHRATAAAVAMAGEGKEGQQDVEPACVPSPVLGAGMCL